MSLAATAVRGPSRPPAKGSFPLDRDHECSEAQRRYLQCLTQHQSPQAGRFAAYDHFPCRGLAKAFLQCRMDSNLMQREKLSLLGFAEPPDAAATPAATADDTPLEVSPETVEKCKEDTGRSSEGVVSTGDVAGTPVKQQRQQPMERGSGERERRRLLESLGTLSGLLHAAICFGVSLPAGCRSRTSALRQTCASEVQGLEGPQGSGEEPAGEPGGPPASLGAAAMLRKKQLTNTLAEQHLPPSVLQLLSLGREPPAADSPEASSVPGAAEASFSVGEFVRRVSGEGPEALGHRLQQLEEAVVALDTQIRNQESPTLQSCSDLAAAAAVNLAATVLLDAEQVVVGALQFLRCLKRLQSEASNHKKADLLIQLEALAADKENGSGRDSTESKGTNKDAPPTGATPGCFSLRELKCLQPALQIMVDCGKEIRSKPKALLEESLHKQDVLGVGDSLKCLFALQQPQLTLESVLQRMTAEHQVAAWAVSGLSSLEEKLRQAFLLDKMRNMSCWNGCLSITAAIVAVAVAAFTPSARAACDSSLALFMWLCALQIPPAAAESPSLLDDTPQHNVRMQAAAAIVSLDPAVGALALVQQQRPGCAWRRPQKDAGGFEGSAAAALLQLKAFQEIEALKKELMQQWFLGPPLTLIYQQIFAVLPIEVQQLQQEQQRADPLRCMRRFERAVMQLKQQYLSLLPPPLRDMEAKGLCVQLLQGVVAAVCLSAARLDSQRASLACCLADAEGCLSLAYPQLHVHLKSHSELLGKRVQQGSTLGLQQLIGLSDEQLLLSAAAYLRSLPEIRDEANASVAVASTVSVSDSVAVPFCAVVAAATTALRVGCTYTLEQQLMQQQPLGELEQLVSALGLLQQDAEKDGF
ncbi:hypothetical protein cyc_00349 [Cyclospora cayetanensis]|uniref:Uncharacterized protein n=1 Tax=Cyclospora cayetanensis TaxID=88456 RepID=A0A1D3D464_9EIME|nr:hypothetical protein cyc_00349 [Cyclospora cayetanensis]